jgi:hypothetical protein
MVDPDATERMEEEIKNETEEDLYKNDDTPLDDEEVEEAKVLIAKLHPLVNTPIH